jgi:hypothetical protein
MVQVHIILFCNFCSPDGELQLRRGILQIFIDGKLEIDGIVTRIQTLRSDLRNIPLHGSATSLLVVNPLHRTKKQYVLGDHLWTQ